MNTRSATSRRGRGDEAEATARRHLEAEGLVCLEQNFSTNLGEIDLIMEHASVVVFVEVRFRKSDLFGSPAATVSTAKQRRIINTAKQYLVTKRIYEKRPARFDVVAISGENLQWIQGAF